MSKKNEFSDLVQDIDRKFKDIEGRKLKVETRLKKLDDKEQKPFIDSRKARLEENKEQMHLRIKEKLNYGLAVFLIGQVMILTVCFKNPQYFLELWACGTFSLCFICLAVIDYS